MKQFELQGHEPSLLPDGLDFELVWHDEFDGDTLDTSKWDYRLCMMGKRHPAWTDKGVTLDGHSHAVFTCLEENGIPVSSQLQTGYNFMDEPVKETKFGDDALQWNLGKLKQDRFTHTYGYYECRCRLQNRFGWWSAFWMQSPIIGATLNPADSGAELDIMECFHPNEVAPHNAFTGGYGQDMKRAMCGGKQVTTGEWHTFGMLWTDKGYTFYVDGEEDGHISEYVSHRPEFLLISTEVKGYRYAHHCPTREAFESVGDTFLVDYVRVFDVKGMDSNVVV